MRASCPVTLAGGYGSTATLEGSHAKRWLIVRFALAIVCVALLGLPAVAQRAATLGAAPRVVRMQSNCDDDSVDTVSDDGSILKTLYGHVYDIYDGASDVAIWLPADDLLVCPTSRRGMYRLINTDEDNEVAYGQRLR